MAAFRWNRIFICTLLLPFTYWVIRKCTIAHIKQEGRGTGFIARVGNQYLYPSDLESIDLLRIDAADKTSFINQYVEEWASKQLLIAQSNYQTIEASIDVKINEYKNELLAYYFLETLVQLQLDSNVSPEEITDYYQKYKHNDFVLHYDIVKGIFLAMPKKANCINAIKSLMLSNRALDLEKLKKYCAPYTHIAILETDKWFPWEAVLSRLGYRPLEYATRLLKTNKFIHVAGKKHIYLLKINQYKVAQDIAPLEAVADRIRAIILHKRKLALINKIKYKLLEDAKKNRTCVIQIR